MSNSSDSVIGLHERIIQNFIKAIRPPEDVRDKLDIGYTFEKQVLLIYEIRPNWANEGEKIEIPVAKCRFIKSTGRWKLYWQRANDKWTLYKPIGEFSDIAEALKAIDDDNYGCFWG